MKIFLDTNIIFDFLLDSRGDFHKPAVDIMRLASKGTIEVGISTSQITDIYYSLRKIVGDSAARNALRKLYSLCTLLETPATACVDALNSSVGDYEDAVQTETAKAYVYDHIITRDTKDHAHSTVSILDPSDFLQLFA